MLRTHYTTETSSLDLDTEVEICGWVDSRRDHGGVVFLDIRDREGILQVVADPAISELEIVKDIRLEYCLHIKGKIQPRPSGTTNDNLPTGQIEVHAQNIEVLNASEALPFQLDKADTVDEHIRYKHRYLDLRRPKIQQNLKLRAKVNAAIRNAFIEQGLTEVETPILIASTPEGARDFVVPSRLNPGSFYALPQSPQLFKQLLMVGGIDKYFQIAKCFRDEDLRADRQFEFTQLDMEMSFAEQQDVLDAVTKSFVEIINTIDPELEYSFETISWFDAMDQYGIDKPDTRFETKLIECTQIFNETEFRAFNADSIKALCVKGQGDASRSKLDDLTEKAKKLGAAGLVWMRVKEDELESPVAKFLSEKEIKDLKQTTQAQPGDLLLLVASDWYTTCSVLGTLRNDLCRPPVSEAPLNFLWVTEFPLFEGVNEAGQPIPAHHPFTMPHPQDMDKLEKLLIQIQANEDLDETFVRSIRSQSYDAVLNGWELGSGSVRIHRGDIQEKVFSILGIDEQTQQQRFGFLLEAFKYGAPPHAGFAYGIDRLTAILAGEDNIREVSAYPKTQSGHDALTNAPSPIDEIHLKELGLNIRPEVLADKQE